MPRGLSFVGLTSALVLVCACSACSGPLSAARSEFDRGHYAEAKQTLVHMQHADPVWSVRERAMYALYSGLTFGALGDVGRACVWLREARGLQEAHPGALEDEDDQRLHTALQTYEVAP